ncbi:MAG TPA: hypothetical protein VNI36_12505 [Candidatus Dormibacteraeota bacterium]|nr:hypothetical protein [Candidatus Dormibacteraeota bacterium]
MRNRKSVVSLLIAAGVVVLFAWLMRTRAPSKPSGLVESGAALVGPADIYPDLGRTPGAINPDITQGNIRKTICNPRWSTRSIRPRVSYTHRLKVQQIAEYGYTRSRLRDYEEDHFIPLELGGNPTDPRNLWPEPYKASIPDGGARTKDKVETYLHAEVCSGSLTLEQAQREITEDWYRVYTTSVPH